MSSSHNKPAATAASTSPSIEQELHAARPGLFNTLERGQLPAAGLWCKDLDIQKCLEGHIIKDLSQISRAGTYILPPLALAGEGASDSLRFNLEELIYGRRFHLNLLASDVKPDSIKHLPENYISLQRVGSDIKIYRGGTVKDLKLTPEEEKSFPAFPTTGSLLIRHAENNRLCDRVARESGATLKVPGALKLLIPANDGGNHWRLAIIKLENSRLQEAVLWDSMPNLTKKDAVYLNLLQNIKDAIRDPSQDQVIEAKVHARPNSLQTDGWSCGDFVIRKCLLEKPEAKDENFDSIRQCIADDTELLRHLVIAQILHKNPKIKIVEEAKDYSLAPKGTAAATSAKPALDYSNAYLDSYFSATYSYLATRYQVRGNTQDAVIATLRAEIRAAYASKYNLEDSKTLGPTLYLPLPKGSPLQTKGLSAAEKSQNELWFANMKKQFAQDNATYVLLEKMTKDFCEKQQIVLALAPTGKYSETGTALLNIWTMAPALMSAMGEAEVRSILEAELETWAKAHKVLDAAKAVDHFEEFMAKTRQLMATELARPENQGKVHSQHDADLVFDRALKRDVIDQYKLPELVQPSGRVSPTASNH